MKPSLGKYSILLPLIISFILLSCIEEFYPDLNTTEELLVINGTIIKGDSIQIVNISRSSPVTNSEFNPISGCIVWVEDTLGNKFPFREKESGTYTASIVQEYLGFNSSFQLNVITPDKNEYRSSYETIFESSPIDSVYSEIEYYQSSSEEYNDGIQFYTDLKAPNGATKNYLWTVEETWEIHTVYPIEGRYKKGSFIFPEYSPISDSISVCWSTRNINEIYTSSTRNLSINEKKKIPLNFVPSTSPKNNHKYSLFVKQYSLGETAYRYWEQNKVAAMESGGLYQKQPSQSRSNIYNVNNLDEIVLGFFWASSYSGQRIFIDNQLTPFNLDCDIFECWPSEDCNLFAHLESLGLNYVYLIVLAFTEEFPDVEAWGFPKNPICIDCTAEGGSIVKPEFWP